MALMQCPECKTNLSTQAVTCPKCDYPFAKERKRKRIRNWAVGLLGLLVLLGILGKPPAEQKQADTVQHPPPTPVAEVTHNEHPSRNPAHEILVKLSEKKRNAAWTQHMKNSNEPCGEVVKSFFQGFDDKHTAFWNIRCANTKALSISIDNDAGGSSKILDCTVLKKVAKVECFKTFAEQ